MGFNDENVLVTPADPTGSLLADALETLPQERALELLQCWHDTIAWQVIAGRVPIAVARVVEHIQVEFHLHRLYVAALTVGEPWNVEKTWDVTLAHFARRQELLRDTWARETN